jgi:hypothetical protein
VLAYTADAKGGRAWVADAWGNAEARSAARGAAYQSSAASPARVALRLLRLLPRAPPPSIACPCLSPAAGLKAAAPGSRGNRAGSPLLTVRALPGRSSGLRILRSESFLYGVFV